MKAQFHKEVELQVATRVTEVAQSYRQEAEGYVLSMEKDLQQKLEGMVAAQVKEKTKQAEIAEKNEIKKISGELEKKISTLEEDLEGKKTRIEQLEQELLKGIEPSDDEDDDDDDEFEEVDEDAIRRALLHNNNANIGYTFGTTTSSNAGFDFKAPKQGK